MRPLLRLLCCAIVLLTNVAVAHAQFVHAQGKQIVDGRGRPLHLHGINLGNWMVTEGYMWKFEGGPQSEREIEEFVTEMLGPTRAAQFWKTYRDTYISRDDVHQIKQMGFDSIRIPMHWKLFTPDNPEGFALLDRVIGWCRDEGLLVVLDLHAAPGGQTGANIDDSDGWPWLYDDAGAQRQTEDLWRRVALRYRDNTTVMGYDLLNEPLPHYTAIDTAKLTAVYRRLVPVVRQEDPHHAIILGGANWDTDFSVFTAPFDPNTIYQLHTYWTPPVQAAVQTYVDFREKNNVPIWLGESGENTDEWVGQFARLLEANDIGWAFWPYKKMDSPRCPVTYAPPPHWDEITAYAKLDRSLAHVEDRQKKRPSQRDIDEAFAGVLTNIQSAHEVRNAGFVHALLPNSAVVGSSAR